VFAALLLAGRASADEAAAAVPHFVLSGFTVQGPNPLGEEAVQKLLAPFARHDASLEDVRAAVTTLESVLRARGYGFMRVVLPRQRLDGGVVTVKIVPIAVSSVKVRGARYWSQDEIEAALPALRPGVTPNTLDVSRNLSVANLNPARQMRIHFASGEEPGTVAANVEVNDRDPLSIFAWLNNTGTSETGDTRVGAGVQHANLFGRDHQFTATYTTSVEEPDNVSQYGLFYQVPLPRRGAAVSLLYANSDVDSGQVADFFNVSGKGSVVTARYLQMFAVHNGWHRQVEVSASDKLFDNNVEFSGIPLAGKVRSRPLAARYEARYDGGDLAGSMYAGAAVNLSGGGDNDDEAYGQARLGADSSWQAYYAGGDARWRRGAWTWVARLQAQYASDPLIPGEQFGLGGINSVRGFEERELSGDRGVQASLELWGGPAMAGRLRWLAFLDGGRVVNANPLPGEIESESIASAGVGLRYNWGERLNARADWGYVLDGIGPAVENATDKGDSKLHFSLVYRFR